MCLIRWVNNEEELKLFESISEEYLNRKVVEQHIEFFKEKEKEKRT
jgi:hypothetical protein